MHRNLKINVMIRFKTSSFNQFKSYIKFFNNNNIKFTTSNHLNNYSITITQINNKQTNQLLQKFTQQFNLSKPKPYAMAA